MRLMIKCLNLEIVELDLSLNHEDLVNRAVNFRVRIKLEFFFCANAAALITVGWNAAALIKRN